MLPPLESLTRVEEDQILQLGAASVQLEQKAARIADSLFKEQKAFLNDKAKFKAALTSRRAGKTYSACSFLLDGALKDNNTISLFVGLTRPSVKNIVWPIFAELNRTHELKCDLLESSLTVSLPNESKIVCLGADQKNFIERLRGPRYRRAVIDEAGYFKEHLAALVDDVLTPALMDLGGELALIGTPGIKPSGYFHDLTEGKTPGWSIHKWSLFNNPFIPSPRDYVADLITRRGWTRSNPTYLREWCGQWVLDLDALVYRFDPNVNVYDRLPEDKELFCVIGVDLGYEPDKTAFSVLYYSPYVHTIWIDHVETHEKMIPSKIAERLKQLIDHFDPTIVAADTGGLGKSIVEEMRKRYSISIKDAEKKAKFTAIALMNGDFIDRHLLVKSSLHELMDQYQSLTKDENGLESPGQPNDLCDSTLYAYRECKAYAAAKKEAPADKNTDAYMEQFWKEEAERVQGAAKEEWWESA